MNSLAAVLVLLAIAGAYWAPTLIAARRRVPNQGSIFAVNLFLGVTVIGWVVALAMALRDNTIAAPAGTYTAHDIGRRAAR